MAKLMSAGRCEAGWQWAASEVRKSVPTYEPIREP